MRWGMPPLHIPVNYPTGCTDEQLQQSIDAIYAHIVASGADINEVLRLTPLAQSGQNELTHRHVRRAQEEAVAARADAADANTRALAISRRSLVVSVAAAALSVALSGAAAYFAWDASTSTWRWEAKQLPILQGIRDETAGERVELREALREQGRLLDETLKAGKRRR
jgi:hypothetical protein